MTLNSVRERDRRTVVIGGLAVAAIVIMGRVLPLFSHWTAAQLLAANALAAEASRAMESVTRARVTGDSLVARRVRLADVDTAFLDGAAPALLAATLYERIGDLAASATTQIASVQMQADSGTAPFLYPRVRVSVTGDWPSVAQFLAALESSVPLLAIRELSLSVDNASSLSTRIESIRADIVVEGIARNRRQVATSSTSVGR